LAKENENPQNADSKMQEDIMKDLGMSKDDISVDLPKCKQIDTRAELAKLAGV